MTGEAIDARCAVAIQRVAGSRKRLALQNAEPDLDLIEPGGVQRQELEADPALLHGQPRAHFGRGVNREIVEHDDQPAARPVPAQGFEQSEKLASATSPTRVKNDPTRA